MKISFSKCKKGEYGYLNYQHFLSSVKTAAVFLVALAIFFGGYFYYGNKENIVTVLSVLTLLPASHLLVLCIMYWRFSTGSEEFYHKLSDIISADDNVFFDSVITIEKGGSYPVNAFVCIGKSLVGYTDDAKTSTANIEKHFKTMLKNNQISGVSTKIFTDEESFLNRVKDLKEKFDNASDEIKDTDFKTISLVKALSL